MVSSQTIKELITFGVKELEGTSLSARLDTEILLSYVTSLSRTKIITSPKEVVSDEFAKHFEKVVLRRKAREPIAYIIGYKEFFGLNFDVSSDVLIPRPETELLVEKSLEYLGKQKGDLNILELGTGSGCISIAIARGLKKIGKSFRIVATDISKKALTIARTNATRHRVNSDIDFRLGDWFSLDLLKGEKFNLIVSNPPYLKEREKLMADVLFEPKEALFGGSDGLEAIRAISQSFQSYLHLPGALFLEIGFGQKEEVGAILLDALASLNENSYSVQFLPDLAGIPRVLEVAIGKNEEKNGDAHL